jgi:hypothetical protein
MLNDWLRPEDLSRTHEMYKEAQEIAAEINLDVAFTTVEKGRHRNITLFDNCQNITKDYISRLVEELYGRFSPSNKKIFNLQFLIPSRINRDKTTEILEAANVYKRFLCGDQNRIKIELERWIRHWESVRSEKPHNVVHFLKECYMGLKQYYPDITKLLCILASIPATTSSAERSFSRLKRVLTEKRSSCSDDRLNDLTIISCYNEISVKIAYSDVELQKIVEEFSIRAPRRLQLI